MKKIIRRNKDWKLPSLGKENRHTSPGITESSKQDEPKEGVSPWDITIKMPKIKDKDRVLKPERKKQLATYKEVPIRLSAYFSTETCGPEDIGTKYSKGRKARTYNQDYSTINAII